MTLFDVLRCSVTDIYSNIQMSAVPDEIFYPWIEELVQYTDTADKIISYRHCDAGRRGSLCQLIVGMWLMHRAGNYDVKTSAESVLVGIFTHKLKRALHEHEG
jgi:hypothetical protein